MSIEQQPSFSRSLALHEQLLDFAECVEAAPQLSDGVLTARVVGEFSAGKTRLLRELFEDLIPEPLFPISSLERQTRLPLELTYGDEPCLSLIKREADYKEAVTVKTLTQFPERHEVSEWDPMQYRLRLTIKEPRLILENGDGYSEEKVPKRLFLIDTPGWNSGDDELAELDANTLMSGHHNLGLVYVSQAQRIDGSTNAEHLRDFMSVLAEADFLEQPNLLFVITHCPAEHAERMKQKARNLVFTIWQELGREPEELDLTLFAVDFPALSASELQQFRDSFWTHLLAPLGQPIAKTPTDPWIAEFKKWPTEWNIRPAFHASIQLLNRAELLLEKAKKNDEFVSGMNMYRLIGLDNNKIRERVQKAWLQQLASDKNELLNWGTAPLPDGHPLQAWWSDYWQANLKICFQCVHAFFEAALNSINKITDKTEDLQEHLHKELSALYNKAQSSLNNSFACLLRTIQSLITIQETEKLMATVFTISILQARYEDYYAQHSASLAQLIN